jgi:hypothetical protein
LFDTADADGHAQSVPIRSAESEAEGEKAHCLSHADNSGNKSAEQTRSAKSRNGHNPSTELSPEAELYRRGKDVLGNNAAGLIKKLLLAKGGNVALARAAIEQASAKENPREYVGAIIRGPPPDNRNMTGII